MRPNETYEYNDDIKYAIGQRIQEARLKKGMDSVVLADYIGVGRNQLSRIENGRANCTLPQLFMVCKLLGCSSDYLLFGDVKKDVMITEEQAKAINNLLKVFSA
jgi:transcriptional regulator with XRE-family HTH domain